MIKLGIIGAGKIVNDHICAAVHAGFSPIAIVARDNSKSVYRFSDEYVGLKPYNNLDEFLTTDFDAILIAASDESKAELLSKVIQLNKPILVEKPVFSHQNFKLLKSLNNYDLVKVAYNRRNYSSVVYLKSELQNISTGIVQINLPELSWISSPEKELVYEMAYANSIHVIDLLIFLFSEFRVTRVIKDKDYKSFNRIVHFENEKFIGTINFMFGTPDTYSLKIQSNSIVLELEPIEVFKSFKSISKIKTSNFPYYMKNLDTNWELSEDDKRFKPGFVRQYTEFSKFIKNPNIDVNLATIFDDEKVFETMNKIMEATQVYD